MNSSESSVIVLDSDDEEDQSVNQPTKTIEIKTNVSKASTSSIPSNLQNIRNSITLTPASNVQHTKPKSITTSLSTLTTKNSNSVSIIPLNHTQNQQNSCNIIGQISKNPQVTKISPKNSPRNSPILKPMTNSGSNSSTGVSSTLVQRKSPNNVGILSNKGKTFSENTRNINNNEVKTIDSLISKSILNSQQKLKIQNSPLQSILKRKFDSNSEINDSSNSNLNNQKGLKRIKPTLISSTISHKWNQFSSTITIDDDNDDEDDNDYLENRLKPKQSKKIVKSRSNSITSSSAPSPSPSASSTATSPQSQSSPATPSSSIKEVNRHSDTPKSFITNSLDKIPKESLTKQSSTLLDKDRKDDEKGLQRSSDSPVSNGNVNSNDKVEERQKNEIIPAFNKLIEACQQADNSSDMNLLIEKKLLKYYHSIHPDYITSKSFKKTVENITDEVLETPSLVYIKLKTIIEELKSRKNSKIVVVSNDGQTSTGNDEVDEQVRKLNKGLRKLKHLIAKMEEEEVDWESDINSSYLKVERFKKRACEIYEKICDLTGESKHAQRTVRKPIIFDHTAYPKINKAIEQFVNKTRTFPDYHDILTILQHCNKSYKLDLTSEELKRIAQDAFVKVGKLLQNRRKTDLYETLSHFTERNKDPALEDKDLNAKLNENKKHYGKINALIQKYAREQDTMQTEKLKAKEETRKSNLNNDSFEELSDNIINKISTKTLPNHEQDHQERLKDDNIKTCLITEEMRNTPSCSSSLRNNIIQDKFEKSEINKNIGDKNDDSNSKINNNNNNTNNSNNNSSSNNSNNLKKDTESPTDNFNQFEIKTKNLVSITSNVNNINKSTFKIANVTSLCENSEKLNSLLPLEKDNVITSTKITNLKSIVPSPLNISNTVNKTKLSEVHEIILSDDEV